MDLHPLALVASDAELADGVSVGPFAVIEGNTILGANTRVAAHAIIRAGTRLGAQNTVHPFAVLGDAPQDRTYAGEPTVLEIGDGNTFREHVTVHRGSVKGGGRTIIGSGSLFMVGVHIAHDCVVGNRLELANGTLLGGHVVLSDHVVIGGGSAIAPFVRVGRSAFVAAGSMVEIDVPPFVIVAGNRARVRTLNRVGLERSGIPTASRVALKRAFQHIFGGSHPRLQSARELLLSSDPCVQDLANFVYGRRADPSPQPAP